MFSNENKHDEAACVKLFEQFFTEVEALLSTFAPEGWENSPLFLAFHPTPQQRYEEALCFHRNLNNLFKSKEKSPKSEEPRLEDFLNQKPDENIDPNKEIVDLLGHCLWDIFSNNHEVVSHDGRVYDLGSFRGSAGFIADYINDHFREISPSYDYIDFYMGSIWIDQRTDLTQVYEWIFRHLQRLRCDWVYNFPQLYLIDMAGMKEESNSEKSDALTYDPNKALEQEIKQHQHKQESDEFREKLECIHEEEVAAAKDRPLPATVLAYLNVYDKLPKGWPHQ